MADHFISGTGLEGMIDASALHVGTSDTSGDALSLRITDGVTGMTRQRIYNFIEEVKRAIIAGAVHGTKFPYL